MNKCVDHLEFVGDTCPDCCLAVDEYGNTEAQFDNCCFPDCGCDGARLCMAPSGASDRSCGQNVEGMWKGETTEQRRAVMSLMGDIYKEKQGDMA
jgi:hypothetical protein